jgi:hypothetical protein
MSKWINPDIHLGYQVEILSMSTQEAMEHNVLDAIMAKPGFTSLDEPSMLERVFFTLIEKFRPELKGGSLVGIEFAMNNRVYGFLYIHPSFRPRQDYEEIPSQRLIPWQTAIMKSVVSKAPMPAIDFDAVVVDHAAEAASDMPVTALEEGGSEEGVRRRSFPSAHTAKSQR